MFDFDAIQKLLFIVALACFILFLLLQKIGVRTFSKIMLLIAVIAVAGAFGSEPLSENMIQANNRVVSNSSYLQDIADDFVVTGHSPFRLDFSSAALKAKKPYIMVKLDAMNGTAVPYAFLNYSNGFSVSEEDIKDCKTILFCFIDNWETALYSGSNSGTGTSERKMCYLYDVESGTLFAESEFKARSLPDSAKSIPHYKVDTSRLTEYIQEYMD